MSTLHMLLHGALPPHIYRLAQGQDLATLRRMAHEHDVQCVIVDGGIVDDKRSFLRSFGAALDFPAYVGLNWDAFEEALRDLEWLEARPMLLVYAPVEPFAAEHPGQWRTALAILESAVMYWSDSDRPLSVFLGGSHRSLDGLPELAEH